MEKKNTVVIGASPNPMRYAYRAVEMLKSADHPVEAVGLRQGEISGVSISTELKPFPNVDTVTLYVGPRNQEHWKEYIKSLKPNRVIFNPGTENDAFQEELTKEGIEVEEACTLVLLSMGNY
ncbi:CoA-binding protein [Cryomorphaceae bacterium 1068]|nr:CoA-binding protein [Cryomorphaceae bacterium 1068]